MAPSAFRSEEELLEEEGDLSEPTEDETEHSLVRFDLISPLGVVASGLDESSADRAPTPFYLGAFSSRGSPSA